MSFLDRLKSLFSGGSRDEVSSPHGAPAPPTDPAGMPTAEPQPAEPQADAPEDRLE
jgi:hypothetical protein